MRSRNRSILTRHALALVIVSVLYSFAQPAETGDPTRLTTTTIRQTESRARTLKTQIDELLRNLERPGAQARGSVPGWERLLKDLRAEAALARTGLSLLESATHAAAAVKEVNEKELEQTRRRFRELDRRLQRLNDTIVRTERSLQELQERLREPEPPRAEERPASPRALGKATKATPIVQDLSGTWLVGTEEWSITHNVQNGTITILNPHRTAAGRHDEYVGTVKGSAIVAKHRVSATSDLSPKMPGKVRTEVARRGSTWTLRLQIAKDGERLEGSHDHQTISYSEKSLKIVKITPTTKKVALTKKPPIVKGPPEPEGQASDRPPPSQEDIELLRRHAAMLRDIAEQWLQKAKEATRQTEEVERRIEQVRHSARRYQDLLSLYNSMLAILERPETLERRDDLEGIRKQLERWRREERSRLARIIDERRAATGASRAAIEAEMRQAGEYRDLEGLEERIRRARRDTDDEWREFYRGMAEGARRDLDRADSDAAGWEASLRRAEDDEEALWNTYHDAQADAARARKAAAEAARRAQGSSRPSR